MMKKNFVESNKIIKSQALRKCESSRVATRKVLIRDAGSGKRSVSEGRVNLAKGKEDDGGSTEEPEDLGLPRLFSSLALAQEIKNLKEDWRTVQVKEVSKPPESKPKSLRVNIPFQEHVYSGLVELDVRPEHLGLPVPLRSRELPTTRDPEPVLSDYFQPDFSTRFKPTIPTPDFRMGPRTLRGPPIPYLEPPDPQNFDKYLANL